MKKLEIEETYIIKMGLVFTISNIFIKKSSLANKWMSLSYSNSALLHHSHLNIVEAD